MPPVNPKVSIILLHFRGRQCLKDCLASLRAVSYDNFSVTVVNNGTEALGGITGELPRPVRVVDSPCNAGFAAGNNLGMREALKDGPDYILLLNDDTVVSPDFLGILVSEGERSPGVGMLGPRVYYFSEPRKIWFAGGKLDGGSCSLSFPHADEAEEDAKAAGPEETDYVTGCAVLVKKAVLDRIGLLDERFFLYWEDCDWGLRAKKAGFSSLVAPAAKILHKVSASSGGGDSPLKAYHKTRSHLLFAKLHAPQAGLKLLAGFLRDIAWLLFKAPGADSCFRARAYFAAITDHYRGRGGRGPDWLWPDDSPGD